MTKKVLVLEYPPGKNANGEDNADVARRYLSYVLASREEVVEIALPHPWRLRVLDLGGDPDVL